MEEKVNVDDLINASLEEPEEVAETVEEETVPTTDETESEEVDEEVETEESDDEVRDGKTVPLSALEDERRKRQEYERQLKEIQDGLNEVKSKVPQQAPKDIFEAFDRDPKGVTRDLNARIKQLRAEDPIGYADEIDSLQDLKSDLRMREVQNIQTQLQKQTKTSEVLQKINTVIPGFNSKVGVLEEFAINELGYTREDLIRATNFDNGDAAVREVARINKLYERFHAKPEKKVVKKKPTDVEGAGKGIKKADVSRDELMSKAKETGNWAAYFEAIGLAED